MSCTNSSQDNYTSFLNVIQSNLSDIYYSKHVSDDARTHKHHKYLGLEYIICTTCTFWVPKNQAALSIVKWE